MLNDLSIPRKEFNGHSACPWIRKYQDRIYVKEITTGVRSHIHHAASMLAPLNYMAICLAFPKKPPFHTIEKAVESVLNDDTVTDIDILINNHRLKGKVRGVYTGFKQCDLVIVQSASKLKWARIASKKSGYYK